MKKKDFSAFAVSAIIGFLLSKLFPKNNRFYGGKISFSTIDDIRQMPGFAGIYFQQGVTDGSKHDDNFDLVAYAGIDDGVGLIFQQIPISPIYDRSYPKTKKLRFGNVILTKQKLDYLYAKPGSTSNLKVYPFQYEDTDYVAYNAETINSPVVAVSLNPSPPARSY